jgi:NADPH-dependent FMN reductase
MTTKPRIAVVIGSTRPGRYADKAAGWILKQAQARDDIEAELLDLLDHPLPFFDEKGPLISMPSENAEALDGEVPNHSTFSNNRHGRFRESNLLRKLFETIFRSGLRAKLGVR